MKTDKTTGAESSTAEVEPLVLKPEWMIDHPKGVEKLHTFTVSFNETTKRIDLTVNGEEYRSMNVRDKLSGMRKYHEAIDKIVKLFSDWGFYENQN